MILTTNWIRRIVKTPIEPKDKSILWLDITVPEFAVLKYYEKGEWKIIKHSEDEAAYILLRTLANDMETVKSVIPSSANSSNKLVDKAYVDSAVSTSSAEFRGTSSQNLSTEEEFFEWANSLPHNLNDYVYWNTLDSDGNTVYKRYKYSDGSWVYEYDLNNSSFSSNEWEAIQSGITTNLVNKLRNLPTNVELLGLINVKQNLIPDLENIRAGAAAGSVAYQLPEGGIPASDLADGVIPEVVGIKSISTQSDGKLQFTLSNDDIVIVDLNHTHNGLLPPVTSSDNDKILKVVSGYWTAVSVSYQTTNNLVTSISAQSTNSEYPSAKCMYDIIGNLENLINAL